MVEQFRTGGWPGGREKSYEPGILSQVVRTEKELVAAMEKSRTFKGLTFIEVILDRTDCNKALLGWGTAVAEYNGSRGAAAG